MLEPDIVVDSSNDMTVVDFSTMSTTSSSAVAYLGLSNVPSGAVDAANHFYEAITPVTDPPTTPFAPSANSLDVSTLDDFHAVLVDASGHRTEVGRLLLPYPACVPAGTTCSAPSNDSADTPTSVDSENFSNSIDVTNATVQDNSDPKSKSGCYSGDPSPFDPVTHTELIDFRTVWYKLITQGAGSMDISTDESRFDTRIDVFQSATKPDASALSFDCDDDFGPASGPTQLQAKLQGVPVAAQQTYWIMISEAAKPTGTLIDPTGQTGNPDPNTTGPFVSALIPFASSAVLKVSIKTVGLDSDKSTLTFASQTVNTTSGSQRITLTAQNGTVGSIVAIPAGDFSVSANTCTTVASGGTCTLDVKFTPTAAGSRTGNLQITSNAVLGPINVSLSGVGQGSSGATLSTNTLAFGDQLVGTTSAAQTVTLTNSGTATLNISGLSISSGPFAIASGSSCQGLATLAGGGTCTVKVTYTPSAVGAAPATSLSIVDDASNSPQTVTLTGNGTDFTVTGSAPGTPSATVPAGQPATYNLLLAPVSGFTGTVTMACDAKTLPSATSCTFNPAAPTLGATAAQVTLTIGTTARTRALQGSSGLALMTSGLVSVFGMLLRSRRTRRSMLLKWCMGLFFFGLLWTGCGGNSAPPVNPQNGGTPAGTYSVKVSGSVAGHTSAPLTVSLIVQ